MFEILAYLVAGIAGTILSLVILERLGLSPKVMGNYLNHLPKLRVACLVIIVIVLMLMGNRVTGLDRVLIAFFANTLFWLGLGLLVHLHTKTQRRRVISP
jgi:hypothetical protein